MFRSRQSHRANRSPMPRDPPVMIQVPSVRRREGRPPALSPRSVGLNRRRRGAIMFPFGSRVISGGGVSRPLVSFARASFIPQLAGHRSRRTLSTPANSTAATFARPQAAPYPTLDWLSRTRTSGCCWRPETTKSSSSSTLDTVFMRASSRPALCTARASSSTPPPSPSPLPVCRANGAPTNATRPKSFRAFATASRSSGCSVALCSRAASPGTFEAITRGTKCLSPLLGLSSSSPVFSCFSSTLSHLAWYTRPCVSKSLGPIQQRFRSNAYVGSETRLGSGRRRRTGDPRFSSSPLKSSWRPGSNSLAGLKAMLALHNPPTASRRSAKSPPEAASFGCRPRCSERNRGGVRPCACGCDWTRGETKWRLAREASAFPGPTSTNATTSIPFSLPAHAIAVSMFSRNRTDRRICLTQRSGSVALEGVSHPPVELQSIGILGGRSRTLFSTDRNFSSISAVIAGEWNAFAVFSIAARVPRASTCLRSASRALLGPETTTRSGALSQATPTDPFSSVTSPATLACRM
mmetsp:Transcript_15544/g.38338  ORF Transcript_15544/g.38338 Transcript_15544/m.38338 type:complete len:523 (-) Transcript_15544:503-2071(-)